MLQGDFIAMNFRAALFDLDGVVVDSEPEYTAFWDGISRDFQVVDNLTEKIKGTTLVNTLRYFRPEDHEEVVRRLNIFEADMTCPLVPGVTEYLKALRSRGIPTAVVTSSNALKMAALWRHRPELKPLFDKILTSEMFKASKPDPDCFLLGIKTFGVRPDECAVFEDSFNGLKAARASGAYVIGLTTSNSAESIASLCDLSIPDFTHLL